MILSYFYTIIPPLESYLKKENINININIILSILIILFVGSLFIENLILTIIFHIVSVIREIELKKSNVFFELTLNTLIINTYLLINILQIKIFNLNLNINDMYLPLYLNPWFYLAIIVFLYRLIKKYNFSYINASLFIVVYIIFKLFSSIVGKIVMFL